jgi:hypothetical protein
VIAGQSQDESLAVCQDTFAILIVSGQERVGLHPVTRVFPDQFLKCGAAVPDQDWEDLVGNGEDMASFLPRQSVVKDAGLVWASVVFLQNNGCRLVLKILLCLN